MATIPATTKKAGVPVIGFIAHVDTSPEMTGAGVRPIVHRGYDGRDLVLPDDPTAVLRLADNPALAEQIGHDIVTASGTTLLGADNKAGVAEIVTAAAYLIAHPEIPHGPIRIGLHAGRGNRPRHRSFRRRAIRRALRLHDGRRPPRRARVRELLGRRDDRHVPRLQHPSRLRQGPHGQRDQGRRGLHRSPAARHAVAGNDRPGTRASSIRTSMQAGVERTSVRLLVRDFSTAGLADKEALLEQLARRRGGRVSGRRASRSRSRSRTAT